MRLSSRKGVDFRAVTNILQLTLSTEGTVKNIASTIKGGKKNDMRPEINYI